MGCSERCDCLHAVRMNNIQECTVTSVQSASCFPSQLVRASDRHSADAGLIPGGARDFLPRVTFQCRLFFSVSIRPPMQSHALTFVRIIKILQSMSDCVGLWQHKNTQQAPLSTKIINLLIVVAQTQWHAVAAWIYSQSINCLHHQFQSIGLLLGIACMDFRKAMTIATIFMMAIMLLGKSH